LRPLPKGFSVALLTVTPSWRNERPIWFKDREIFPGLFYFVNFTLDSPQIKSRDLKAFCERCWLPSGHGKFLLFAMDFQSIAILEHQKLWSVKFILFMCGTKICFSSRTKKQITPLEPT
jgi:hypothetical protein